jgi:tetratricopeptide (TPR) repeat protein
MNACESATDHWLDGLFCIASHHAGDPLAGPNAESDHQTVPANTMNSSSQTRLSKTNLFISAPDRYQLIGLQQQNPPLCSLAGTLIIQYGSPILRSVEEIFWKNAMPRKQTGNQAEARKAFGALLQWHLKRGTRPNASPGARGTDWSQLEFSGAVRVSGALGERTDRTVRNWCSGSALPSDLRPIEIALFGPEPRDGTTDRNADFRQMLRLAFQRAKSGDGVVDIPVAAVATTLAPASIRDPGFCFGRAAEVARLAAALLADPEGGSALVLGNAGHGKTMLTQAVGVHAEVVARFGTRRWFVELERADNAAAALAEVAEALGLGRAAAWPAVAAVLGHRQRPALLVLDNLETPLQATGQRPATEQLLRDLAALPGLSLLASLRSQETIGAVAWTDEIILEPLAPAIAKPMFLAIARSIAETDPDLDFFLGEAGVLGGIPLAIRLVAHCVFRAPTLAALRREWLRTGALLAQMPGADDTRAESLLASVEFSFRSSRLKWPGRRLFALLGQLPAGLSEADRDALLDGAGFEAAAQLRAVGLLKDAGADRIGLLPPIRDIANRRFAPDAADTAAWTGHYLDLVAQEGKKFGKPNGHEALGRLAPEMTNVVAAIAAMAATATGRAAAVAALENFEAALSYTGRSATAALATLRRACARDGDRLGEARCLFIQADSDRFQRKNDEAIIGFRAALALLDETGGDKLAGLCQWSLAEIAREQFDDAAARDLCAQALASYQRAGWRPGEADCLSSLAEFARARDDHAEAVTLFEEARAIYAGGKLIRSVADCLWGIAEMARAREDDDKATRLFQEALDIYQRAGAPSSQADCLCCLALIAGRRGAHDDARQLYADAKELAKSSREAGPEINIVFGLAELARQEGDTVAARSLYRQALDFYVSLGALAGHAACLLGLAQLDARDGDMDAARGTYEQALDIITRTGGLIDRAKCLIGLGELALARQDEAAARALLEEARDLCRRSGYPAGAATCDRHLSNITVNPIPQ